jgi:hypothetical protein
MYTYFVFQDKQLKRKIENQDTDMEVFKYLLRAQSQSTQWALKYGGWYVEVLDQDTGITTDYAHYVDKIIEKPLHLSISNINNSL